MLGSSKDDVLILEEFDDSVFVNIRNTKDFRFVSVNTFSNTSSKVVSCQEPFFFLLVLQFIEFNQNLVLQVYLINAADPLSGLTLIWECEPHAHCIVEHHRGFFYLFTNAARSGTPVDSHYLLCCAAGDIKSRNWEVGEICASL